jgi:signal transduction histidine kinase
MTLPFRLTRMPLRSTILALVVLPITLTIGLIGYFALNWLEQEAEARMREDIGLIARALQQPLNQAIRTGEPVLLQESLRSAFSFGRIYGAHIYGRDGSMLAGAGAGVRRFSDERTQALATLDARGEGYAALGEEPTHAYFLPLTTQGGRIAAILQLTRNPDDLSDTLNRIRTAGSVGLGAVIVLLSLIVIIGHRRAIGAPLSSLSDGIEKVTEGRLDYRLTPDGPREIRALGEGFNEMLDRIEQATDEIAERRSAQSQLQADLQATRKLAAVGELSAGIAHQLGTPLGVLDGRAQRMLRRDDLDGPMRESLEGIRAEVQRISDTVRQLMDFARSRPLQRRPTRLGAVIESAVERTRDDEMANNTRIEIRDTTGDRRMMVDALRIEGALCNLLRNAVQASPKGLIRVVTGEDATHYHIRVEDDGPGVPQTERPRLFEPFHTTKPIGSGTGLGLAVAHGIARGHGGSLTLCAEGSLSGACFRLSLPKRETEVPE